jgi:hypothetical protein
MAKWERALAAKRHDPTAVGRKQIESKFRKIFAEELEFISLKNMKDWYGRYDGVAIKKFEAAWQEYWDSQDWNPRKAPKLSAVGPVNKGYAVCRKDKLKNWLY